MKPLDVPETIGVPAVLLVLAAMTIGFTGLNQPLFLALQHLFAYLPDIFWENITVLGDALVVLVLLSIGTYYHRPLMVAGLIGGSITTLVVRTLKPLLAIDRPLTVLGDQVHSIGPSLHTSSFPSGHTTAIFLLAGLFSLAAQNRRLAASLFCFALLVGMSRTAVGAHWPVDTCVGAALGWSCAWLGWHLAPRWRWAYAQKGQRVLAIASIGFALALFLLNTRYPHAFSLQVGIATVGLVVSLAQARQAFASKP